MEINRDRYLQQIMCNGQSRKKTNPPAALHKPQGDRCDSNHDAATCAFLRQHRTELVVQMRSQIFRQIV